MNESELREMFRRRKAEREAEPPITAVRSMLRAYLSDADSMDEVRSALRATDRSHPHTIDLYLVKLQALLADVDARDELLPLVEWDANTGLDDSSEAGARQFLEEIATILREIVAERS